MINDTLSPFWLSLGDEWVHLQGVAPEWERSPERPSSEFVSVGGRRHVQVARRVSREWGLNFEYATPEALAALQVAAEEPGRVLLYDETAAAVNMLDPRDAAGADHGLPWMNCDGIPLRSLVTGVNYQESEHVIRAVENLVVTNANTYAPNAFGFLTVGAPLAESVVKFSVPAPWIGWTLVGAELVLRYNVATNANLSVHESSTGWTEGFGTVPGGSVWYEWPSFTPAPAAVVPFPGAPTEIAVPLPLALAAPGTRAFRLVSDGDVLTGFADRHSPDGPRLRLTYAHHGRAHQIVQPVMPDRTYTLTFYTDAPAGETVLTRDGTAAIYNSLNPNPGQPYRQQVTLHTDPGQTTMLLTLLPGPWRTTGLQLTPGLVPPLRWMAGQRSPCEVSVGDAERLHRFTPDGYSGCDPYRGLSRDDWTLTVREVG